jgi:hypothetical protein
LTPAGRVSPLSKYHDGNDCKGDCEKVFEQGGGQIAPEQFRDKGSCFGARKCSNDTADDSRQSTEDEVPLRESDS